MRNILIVDDEPHMTRVLKLYLERAGYAVAISSNGRDALSAISSRAPDALVTDIQMPLMTGKQLCLALEEQMPARAFPIFVMTSLTDREHRDWTKEIKNLEFLEKPLSMRMLVHKLQKCFEPAPATEGANRG